MTFMPEVTRDSYFEDQAADFKMREMERIESDIIKATESFPLSAEAQTPPWVSNDLSEYGGSPANPAVAFTRPGVTRYAMSMQKF